ncbi:MULTISPECIES: ribosome silencing factor [Rhodomicrobium]|uniref:ribosome silencing factor n=1 Tax=Rhodomicrobium TaxID=1068 RepID=UPI000B4BDA0C|nr:MULTISPECIES: ribosome silencing factor [Rhodomicrobium]
MHTSTGAALRGKPKSARLGKDQGAASILTTVLDSLSDAKAEDVVSIDLHGKTSIGDTMVIASGRSQRHVGAIADQLRDKLKADGVGGLRVEGMPHCDWVLIDAGDVIVHIFRPEVRQFYNLEKMWSADRPTDPVAV